MDFIVAWNDILQGKRTKASLSSSVLAMLQNRASAYLARENRRKERAERLKRENGANVLSYQLYYKVALYYHNHYLNGKRRPHPLDEDTNATHEHRKTEDTKHRYYIYCRYEQELQQVRAQFKQTLSDDEIMERLFSLMPQTAFEQNELDIWKRIYEYATTVNADHTATKRSDKRTKKPLHCTYLKFADWLEQNNDYSSEDRNFVARMTAYYESNGVDLPKKKVDDLLRYYSSREYFGEGDFAFLGFTTKQQIKRFFEVLDKVKRAQQKK